MPTPETPTPEPRPRRRALTWTDPVHLRPALRDLPRAPGVYVFHGEEGGLPLYIGKSVDIRSRVQAHLRNPDEARMLRQARRISHVRTAGEIGALLLEARMIKSLHPVFNQRLRRNRALCSLRIDGAVPEVVYAKDVDFAIEPGLHGLFTSRHTAAQALRDIADAHRLCLGLLGLERLSPGRPCFRAMLRKCAGACSGGESRQAHDGRLKDALRDLALACWPHPGAVALVERDGEFVQFHTVRNWCHLGSADTLAEARRFGRLAAGFDADGYRILCAPMLRGEVEIQAL